MTRAIIRLERGRAVEEWIEEDCLGAHAPAEQCEVETSDPLMVGSSSEMNINVAWSNEERNEEKVEN
jgi:hypothetical protein